MDNIIEKIRNNKTLKGEYKVENTPVKVIGIGGTALDIVGGTAGGVAAGAISTSVVANIAEAISKTKVR